MKDKYVNTQISMLSELVSNTLRFLTSKKIKDGIDSVDNAINSIGGENTITPEPLKKIIRETIKVVTTRRANRIIEFIEKKSDEDLKKVTSKIITHNYRIMKKSYDGLLGFVVTKMSENETYK